MSTELAIPEHLKKYAQTNTNDDASSLASASISIPRISLRGRKFRLIEGGEEIKKPSDELLCVILAVEPGAGLFTKTFYDGVYQSGDSAPPTCASSDGIAPDPWISTPVSAKCATCPKNVFGSATSRSGKKAKACRDSKRLWVALPEAVGGTVFALGVPVTSLKAVSELGRQIKGHGIPLASVIVKVTMEDTEFPQLQFEVAGYLPETDFNNALERSNNRDWDLRGASSGPMLEHQAGPKPGQAALAASIEAGGVPAEKAAQVGDAGVDTVVGGW